MDYPAASTYALLKNFDHERNYRNADRFLKNVYHYYSTKGLGAVILTQLCAVVSLGFTIGFSVFFICFINWRDLHHCQDEVSCDQFKKSFITSPFHKSSYFFSFLTILYFILFGLFWVWRTFSALNSVKDAMAMAKFYHEQLGLSDAVLQDMPWHEVIERVIVLHNRGTFLVVPSTTLTVHEVAMRIMRKENYLIGLVNKHCMDLSVPWWMSSFMSGRLFLTKSLEWSLSFCVLEYMFDDAALLSPQQQQEQYADMPDVSPDFLNDVSGLQWRFQVVGLIHFLLLPFMLAFMTVHFFLQNAQQFHSSKAYLGPRQWSPLALWQFREFNELPHVFEERINRSYKPADEYVASFHNRYIAIVARLVAYIAGAFVATLLLISLVSEGVLLYVQYGEHNLLWYLGIFTAVFAAARAFIPDETQPLETPAELLTRVTAHTHHCPDHWQMTDAASTLEVREEVAELFQYKAQLFLMEVLSAVLTPSVLCFSLPASAPVIVDFVRQHTRFVQGVGAVCDFSLFELNVYGDENYGCDTPPPPQRGGDASGAAPGNQPVGGAGYKGNQSASRPEGGKLEMSFLSFRQAHPNYAGNAAGNSMLNRINSFRDIHHQQRESMLSSRLNHSLVMSGMGGMGGPQFSRGFIPGRFAHGGARSARGDSIDENDEVDSGDADPPSGLGYPPHQDPQHYQQYHPQQHNQYNDPAGYADRGFSSPPQSRLDPPPRRVESCSDAGSLPCSPVISKSDPVGETAAAADSETAGGGAAAQFVAGVQRDVSNESEDTISPFAFTSPPADGGLTASQNYTMGYAAASPTSADATCTSAQPPRSESYPDVPALALARPQEGKAGGESEMVRPIRTTSTDSNEGAAGRHGHGVPHFPNRPFMRRNRSGESTGSPRRIEMSGFHGNRSRSLLYDSSANASMGRSSNFFGASDSGRGDMPSVLLSVLRAENIDYENDFYWLNRFNHERRHRPQSLEQSMQRLQVQRQQSGNFSPGAGGGGGSFFAGNMQDVYGTASAFISSRDATAGAVDAGHGSTGQRQQQPTSGDAAGMRSPPGWSAGNHHQGASAAPQHHSYLHSPVVARNTLGGFGSRNQGGNGGNAHRHTPVQGRAVLSKLPENDQEDEAAV